MESKIPAGKFKAECLKIMDKVKKSRRKVIITKRNVPVAKLVPLEEEESKRFGKLKGTVHIHGDIIASVQEKWNADS